MQFSTFTHKDTLIHLFKNGVFVLLKSILVIAILLSCGLGSSLVQIVAWATMIPDQLDKTGNIVAAIENTFDGNHPCPMCKLAAELRPAEQEPEQPGSDKPNNRDSERKKIC